MRILSIIPLALILFIGSLSAQSSVWKVSDGVQTLYLGGTCHILRKSDFPLPKEFENAYAQTDSLVFEVDPALLQDPAFAMRLMAASVYRDGRTLKTVLNAEAYTALAEHCRQANIPIEILEKTKPGMAVMMLMIQELTKSGVTEEGVDLYFGNRAQKDGKAIDSLETPDFQLELIVNMGEGIESEMVLYSLQDLDQVSTYIDQIIRAWRQGDLKTIEQLFVKDMAAYPEIYNQMLRDRNLDWIPKIEAMLKTAPTEFVLVGVGHMPGEDGLIQLLEAKGYTVEQL